MTAALLAIERALPIRHNPDAAARRAFAAGAMLFVISHEIIPESHRHGHEQAATLGVTGVASSP